MYNNLENINFSRTLYDNFESNMDDSDPFQDVELKIPKTKLRHGIYLIGQDIFYLNSYDGTIFAIFPF